MAKTRPIVPNKKVTSYYSWLTAMFIFVAFIILAKTAYLMFVERDYWLAVGEKYESTIKPFPATRGNILSADGQVLATSLPEYRIYLDPMSWEPDSARRVKDQHKRDSILNTKVDSMLTGMKRILPDLNMEETRERIMKGRSKESHSISLYPKRVTYIQLTELKKLPLLNLPVGKSGLYTEEFRRRKNPYGRLAIRTIGNLRNENDEALNGLELAYDSVLSGKPGYTRRQKVGNRYLNILDTPAVAGCDVVTTLDVGMQDLTEKVLGEQLKAIGAKVGMCILMEVQTGNVKAISSLSRLENGNYAEIDPRAVTNMMEPGSVFKPMSFMVAMEDRKIDMNTTFNTGNGIREMHGRKMRDSDWRKGGNGVLTVPEIIKKSSNVGVSSLIDNAYSSDPDKFVEGLQRIGIMEDLHIPIPGYKKPRIRFRRDNPDRWYGTTLPWMSIGYETQVPPISTLTFYNGVANGGKLVQPRFVTEIRRGDEVVQEFPTVVLRERMCRPEVLRNIQICLEGVVGKNSGTGKAAYSKYFPIAGKTGTAQIWSKAGFASNYLVSFAGYFPANAPKYSMIVCIEKSAPAYGGIHCGPVFRKIAEGVMARNFHTNYNAAVDTTMQRTAPPFMPKGNLVALNQVLTDLNLSHSNNFRMQEGLAWGAPALHAGIALNNEGAQKGLPSVVGYGLRDAVYRLERMGVKVRAEGFGHVVAQSLPPGTPLKRGLVVRLVLSTDKKAMVEFTEEEENATTTADESKPASAAAPKTAERDVHAVTSAPAQQRQETQRKTEHTSSKSAVAAKTQVAEKKRDAPAEPKKPTAAKSGESAKHSAANGREKSVSTSEKKGKQVEKKSVADEKKSTTHDRKTNSSDKKSSSTEKKSASSEKRSTASEKKVSTTDKKASSSEKKQSASERKKDNSSTKKGESGKSKSSAEQKTATSGKKKDSSSERKKASSDKKKDESSKKSSKK